MKHHCIRWRTWYTLKSVKDTSAPGIITNCIFAVGYFLIHYFTHSFNGNKITATNLNFIHLSYLGSSFLATITVSDKTLACTPVYSLKLVNVQFTFWVRAHLSSTEILPVALVKVSLSQMALVMSSYPSCSRSASISKFVEVKVTQQNVWMTSRVWFFVPCPNPGSSACSFCEVETLTFTSFFPHISFLGFCSDPDVRTLFSSQFCLCDHLSLSKPHACLKVNSGFPEVSLLTFSLTSCHKNWSGSRAVPCKLTNHLFSLRRETHFSILSFSLSTLFKSCLSYGSLLPRVQNSLLKFLWCGISISHFSLSEQ